MMARRVPRTRKAAAPARTRAIGYVRVSLEKQAQDGISLDAQRARIEAYAKLYDVELVDVVVETGSAKSLERPGLQRVLGRLKKGQAGAVIVARLDRLTRSVADLGTLVAGPFGPGGAALLSVSEQVDTRSAGGRLVLNVIASISQWEREQTAERTSAALRHMRAEGEYIGGAEPYGYRLDADRLLPVAEEQATIARAKELHAEGLSLRTIAGALAAEGHLSRAGRPFAAAQVRRLVLAPLPPTAPTKAA